MLIIEQIRPELTWRLRQRVMYPDKTVAAMQMDEDFNGYHFGAFMDGYIVGVVSLFQNGTDFQFRKFAVDNDLQNTGIGKALLKYMEDFAIAGGATRIWCNAWVNAIGFYLKYGYVQTGTMFSKYDHDYEIMEKMV